MSQQSFDFIDKMTDIRAKAVKQMFAIGVEMLMAQGKSEDAARAFLGKRIKEIGKGALVRAIAAAAFNEVANPTEYIAASGRVAPGRAASRAESDDDDNAGLQPWME